MNLGRGRLRANFYLLFSILLSGWSGVEARASDASAPKKVTAVEGVTEYALDNGLQVLVFPDESQPRVTVNVTYRVGSRHEGGGEKGMAHLLEHMVFKGTPTIGDIWGALEDHGARFNGTTSEDRTNYYEILTADDENLEFALRMEADRMVNSEISAEDLASEMTVVRNEFEKGESNPFEVLSERLASTAFLWHPYGQAIIGNRSDIERVPVENLRRFYKKYYQPDNATLLVAGKFDSGKAVELISKYFGSIARPARVLEDTYTEEPPQDGPRSVTLRRVGDLAAAGLVYHIPAGSHPDFPAVQVLSGVLIGEPEGRLYKALVERGLASSVWGYPRQQTEPGLLHLVAEVRTDQDAKEVLSKMIGVVEGVAGAAITEEEVERIKRRRLKDIKLAMADTGRIGVYLSEYVALGDWRMFFVNRDRLKEVTLADVVRVAKQYLIENNRTAGLFVPTQEPARATIPPKPVVAEFVKNYTGSEEIQAGEAFASTPQNIEKRTQRRELQNGIKLAALSKETRGDAVHARFRLHFGTEKDLTGHSTATELIPELLMRGTARRDYQELSDEIDRLQSRIRLSGGDGDLSASIVSDRANVVSAIELLAEILQKPAFAPDQFEIVVKAQLAWLEENLSNPQARSFQGMSRALNPWPADSIHYVPTQEEEIERLKSVSLGTIKDLHARFYGASDMEVSIVGDFDEAAVESAIERSFGSWKSPSKYVRVAQPYLKIEGQRRVITTPDKENAVVTMGTVVKIRDDDADFPALEFAGYVLGQSAKSRLINRLRQQEGLSYGAGAFLRASSQDRRASMYAYAMCAPQNSAKAEAAMGEEIKKWIAQGITEDELKEGISGYVLQFENYLTNDSNVAGELVGGLEIGRTMEYHVELLEKIKSLTTTEVKRVLAKHMAGAAFPTVLAGDLAGAAP